MASLIDLYAEGARDENSQSWQGAGDSIRAVLNRLAKALFHLNKEQFCNMYALPCPTMASDCLPWGNGK